MFRFVENTFGKDCLGANIYGLDWTKQGAERNNSSWTKPKPNFSVGEKKKICSSLKYYFIINPSPGPGLTRSSSTSQAGSGAYLCGFKLKIHFV